MQVSLEESYNPQIGLDVFKEDPNFQETEQKYEVSLAPSCRGCSVVIKIGWRSRAGLCLCLQI